MNSSHLDDPDYGVDYGGDYGIVPHKETKVKRIKKSRKRKIKILPEEDDDDQVRPIASFLVILSWRKQFNFMGTR